jgi:hypothetical protein
MMFSAASVVRMPRSLTSLLQMSVLMCFGMLTKSVLSNPVVSVVDSTNARQLLLRGSAVHGRQLSEPEAPFDFYNNACKKECEGDEGLTLFDNACPKCPDKYESEHCNHCCYAGASSLKFRWHGCPSTITFASSNEQVEDCSLEAEDRAPTDGIRFIDCACYDRINTPETFDPSACQLLESVTFTDTRGTDSDICIVSVNELDTFGPVIDFSKPLPAIIGLVHHPLTELEENSTSSFWNPYPLRTYFDTTCSINENGTEPFVLPLFPGYGKLPNSCPSIGFVDLETPDSARLPGDIHQYD